MSEEAGAAGEAFAARLPAVTHPRGAPRPRADPARSALGSRTRLRARQLRPSRSRRSKASHLANPAVVRIGDEQLARRVDGHATRIVKARAGRGPSVSAE